MAFSSSACLRLLVLVLVLELELGLTQELGTALSRISATDKFTYLETGVRRERRYEASALSGQRPLRGLSLHGDSRA
jgi:hypothetical protein